MSTIPKPEPELRRAKGRAYAARCNEIASNYDSKTIFQALELSEQAHEVHRLAYASGLSNLKEFPPNRFEWICDEFLASVPAARIEKGRPKEALKIKSHDRGPGGHQCWL